MLDGVSVNGIGLAIGVSEIVVDGGEAGVSGGTVAVPGGKGGVDVPVPLQAATDNTSKRINRLMYSVTCRLCP